MNATSPLSPIKGLQTLFWLRSVTILGQLLVVFMAVWGLAMDLPLVPMLSTIGVLTVWNLAAFWRLRMPWVATQPEILLNLTVDATALTFLLYWSGGATNPFVSLYLIPIAIAAAVMPLRYVWAITLMCIGYYSFLMLFYLPLPPVPAGFGTDFNAHIFGMWVNFILSAALMAVVVARIAGAVRQRDSSLAKVREEALSNEKIVAMGTLAAGVAHEISTPLSTMTLLVGELRVQPGLNEQMRNDLELMNKQIDICKERVKGLLDSTGHTRSEGGRPMPLREFMDQILDQWLVMRPEIELKVDYQEPFQNPILLAEPTIAQSVINLLNNAADATIENGNRGMAVNLSSSGQNLLIRIDDEGKGITPELAEQAGQAFFSTKDDGFGIGLVLSNASLGRFGGEVVLTRRPEQGTRTQVTLPLEKLIIEQQDLSNQSNDV